MGRGALLFLVCVALAVASCAVAFECLEQTLAPATTNIIDQNVTFFGCVVTTSVSLESPLINISSSSIAGVVEIVNTSASANPHEGGVVRHIIRDTLLGGLSVLLIRYGGLGSGLMCINATVVDSTGIGVQLVNVSATQSSLIAVEQVSSPRFVCTWCAFSFGSNLTLARSIINASRASAIDDELNAVLFSDTTFGTQSAFVVIDCIFEAVRGRAMMLYATEPQSISPSSWQFRTIFARQDAAIILVNSTFNISRLASPTGEAVSNRNYVYVSPPGRMVTNVSEIFSASIAVRNCSSNGLIRLLLRASARVEVDASSLVDVSSWNFDSDWSSAAIVTIPSIVEVTSFISSVRTDFRETSGVIHIAVRQNFNVLQTHVEAGRVVRITRSPAAPTTAPTVALNSFVLEAGSRVVLENERNWGQLVMHNTDMQADTSVVIRNVTANQELHVGAMRVLGSSYIHMSDSSARQFGVQSGSFFNTTSFSVINCRCSTVSNSRFHLTNVNFFHNASVVLENFTCNSRESPVELASAVFNGPGTSFAIRNAAVSTTNHFGYQWVAALRMYNSMRSVYSAPCLNVLADEVFTEGALVTIESSTFVASPTALAVGSHTISSYGTTCGNIPGSTQRDHFYGVFGGVLRVRNTTFSGVVELVPSQRAVFDFHDSFWSNVSIRVKSQPSAQWGFARRVPTRFALPKKLRLAYSIEIDPNVTLHFTNLSHSSRTLNVEWSVFRLLRLEGPLVLGESGAVRHFHVTPVWTNSSTRWNTWDPLGAMVKLHNAELANGSIFSVSHGPIACLDIANMSISGASAFVVANVTTPSFAVSRRFFNVSIDFSELEAMLDNTTLQLRDMVADGPEASISFQNLSASVPLIVRRCSFASNATLLMSNVTSAANGLLLHSSRFESGARVIVDNSYLVENVTLFNWTSTAAVRSPNSSLFNPIHGAPVGGLSLVNNTFVTGGTVCVGDSAVDGMDVMSTDATTFHHGGALVLFNVTFARSFDTRVAPFAGDEGSLVLLNMTFSNSSAGVYLHHNGGAATYVDRHTLRRAPQSGLIVACDDARQPAVVICDSLRWSIVEVAGMSREQIAALTPLRERVVVAQHSIGRVLLSDASRSVSASSNFVSRVHALSSRCRQQYYPNSWPLYFTASDSLQPTSSRSSSTSQTHSPTASGATMTPSRPPTSTRSRSVSVSRPLTTSPTATLSHGTASDSHRRSHSNSASGTHSVPLQPTRTATTTYHVPPPPPNTSAPTPAPPPTVSPGESTTTVASAGASVAIGAAAGAAGGAAAADSQSLLVIGLTSCATPSMRQLSDASRRSLLPLGALFGDFEGSELITHICLMFGLCAVHFALVIIRQSWAPSFGAAASMLRFPSLQLVIFNLLFQGLTLDTATLLLQGHRRPAMIVTIVASATALACFVFPLWAMWWCRMNLAQVPYRRYDHRGRNRVLVECFFAKGFWDADNPRSHRMKSLFGSIDGARHWMLTSAAQLRAIAVAVIAAADGMPCAYQASGLAVVFIAYALVIFVRGSQRVRAAHVFSPLVSLLSGLISLATVSDSSAELASRAVMVVSAISTAGAVAQLIAMVLEKVWQRQLNAQPVTSSSENPSQLAPTKGTTNFESVHQRHQQRPEVAAEDEASEMEELRTPMLLMNKDQQPVLRASIAVKVDGFNVSRSSPSQRTNPFHLTLGSRRSRFRVLRDNGDIDSSFSSSLTDDDDRI